MIAAEMGRGWGEGDLKMLLALKLEQGAMNQGLRVASRKNSPTRTVSLGLLTSRTIR